MHFINYIPTIDTHTLGEPTRIITGGLPAISGASMLEKRAYMKKHLDYVRTTIMNEPRGHHNMFGALITEYVSAEAAFGLIFMDGDGYLNMCGHSSIGAVTAAIETGIIPAQKPETKIKIDVPIGQIEAAARIDEDGEIEHVSIKGIPAFIFARDIPLETYQYGTIRLDVGFGGSFVALVDSRQFELEMIRENADEIIALGMEIKDKANEAIQVKHPHFDHITQIEIVNFLEAKDPAGHKYKNVGVFGHEQLDRSPCGTGICAILAGLYEDKTLRGEEELLLESIIGTRFSGMVAGITAVGPFKGIIPEFKSSAYITGFNQVVVDPCDPVKFGFRLG